MLYDGTIVGKTVYLRSATMDDLEFTYEIRQDRERTKYMHAVTGGLEAQRQWLEHQMAAPGDYFFVVYDKKSGKRIGTASIYRINPECTEGKTGRSIFNGNPIQNLETFYLFYEFAFYGLGLQRLYAEILRNNLASVGSVFRMGGEKVSQEYNEEFKDYMEYYVTQKSEYAKRREGLKKLVDRFADRQSKN